MAFVWHPGVDCAIPATNKAVRANGDATFAGWPSSQEVEAQVAAWFDAETFEEERAARWSCNLYPPRRSPDGFQPFL
jgi:peptide/nickel transport system substrate-binding protein